MLNYAIIASKPYIEKESDVEGSNKVKFKDLLSNVIDDTAILTDCFCVTVTEPYIARPDLISNSIYGTDQYADIICKINGISNPFELNTGMKLVLPDITTIQNMIMQGKASSIAQEDDTISKTIKTNQKRKNESRSPGEQTVSETNFIIDEKNRIVIY